jgi:CubicO group peptidase (beta-lactamase class C family)
LAWLAVASAAILGAVSTGGPQRAALAEALAAFGAFYEASLRDYGIVGSSFALVQDGQVVDRRFYGLADADQRRPVDERTIFHWASITKTFTGVAIMQLRDRGRLTLDDPVVKYVPELRDVHDPQGDVSEITIRHLMSHTAGFRMATWPWGGDAPWHPFEPRTWGQLVAMMPYTEVLFEPGSRYSYSNPGVVFLGRVIEQLSGDDYEVYVDKNIFRPLGMSWSYFDTTPYHLLEHRAHSYWRRDGVVTAARFDADTGITVSNGGLNAPMSDMVTWLNFLTGTRGDPARQRVHDGVLARASLEEMWVPRAEVLDAPKGGPGNRRDFVGLAFFIEDNFGRRFIGHSGEQNAFISHFYLDPTSGGGYVVAYNTWVAPAKDDPRTTDTLDIAIKDHLFERVFPLLGR